MSGIQDQLLEVTVAWCTKLKDTEWFSRQDPYVVLQYGNNKFRTRTCTDGGKNPVFQEKFAFNLIEGLRELEVFVWNSNTLTFDDFIGRGKIQLHKALSEGFDDATWPLQTNSGRCAGAVRLVLHFANARKQPTAFAPSAAPYAYGPPPPAYATLYPSPYSTHPPSSAYPPPNSGHAPSAYPQPSAAAYPPSTYLPPSAYPPSAYPLPPNASPYHPPGSPSMTNKSKLENEVKELRQELVEVRQLIDKLFWKMISKMPQEMSSNTSQTSSSTNRLAPSLA